MPKIYKICLFLSLIALFGAISHFALAQQQGKGYFLEKGNEVFIFDNINIRGYFLAEEKVSERRGLPGDVLIENQFILDKDSSFYFCKDERQRITNLPLNTDCGTKVLVWRPQALEVINREFYQLRTDKILTTLTTGELSLQAAANISTNDPVRITGCFANDGNDDCDLGELRTANLYLDGLAALAGEITLDGNNISFSEINLGPLENLDNQSLCWKTNSSCPSSAKGNSYTNPTFRHGSVSSRANLARPRVCCYLKIINF